MLLDPGFGGFGLLPSQPQVQSGVAQLPAVSQTLRLRPIRLIRFPKLLGGIETVAHRGQLAAVLVKVQQLLVDGYGRLQFRTLLVKGKRRRRLALLQPTTGEPRQQ